MTFANTGRFAGFVAGTQNALSAGSVITNRGTMVFADAPGNSVHSPNAVIALGAGHDTVTNSGKVVGDIHLGQGDNVFDGQGGTLLGTVFAGLGNDTFYLRRP